MSDRIRAIYKYAKNDLGYEKKYIDRDLPAPDGWHIGQADAIADVPKAPTPKPKRAPGRPPKKKV